MGLVQWFKRYVNSSNSGQQAVELGSVGKQKTVKSYPELTNADLEFLFNQLLEGVYQGRGQQWALDYLQRMENRISNQRWIEWLLGFAEKFLASPAPNYQLATRMVQLGELGIGEVGELAYEIGIGLLTRDVNEPDWSEEENEETIPGVVIPIADTQEWTSDLNKFVWENDSSSEEARIIPASSSPGQELIRDLGELLWEYEEANAESATVIPKIALEFDESLHQQTTPTPEVDSQFDESLHQQTTPTPEVDSQFDESLHQQITSTPEVDSQFDESLHQQITPTPEVDSQFDESLHQQITPTPEVDSQFDEADAEYIISTEEVEVEEYSQQEFINQFYDLFREYDDVDVEPATSAQQIPSEHHQPYGAIVTRLEQNKQTIASFVDDWNKSLVNLPPNLAITLDELLVRLEESANLVQQLASELGTQNHSPQVANVIGDQSQTWFYHGLQQVKAGNLSGALSAYAKAIEINPYLYEYWFNQGLTLFHSGYFAEAVASYDRAVEIKPDSYKGWYYRGGALSELGQPEEALDSFNQAVAIKPDYQEVMASRGLTLLKLGLILEAIATFDMAVSLQPQDQENWYYRGIALATDGRNSEAIASYDQAIKIQPDYHEVWIDRGVALCNAGQWSAAISSWDAALEIKPDFYLTWFNRGIALDNLRHREDAIASYDQALYIKPDFHLAWYNRAVALFYLQRHEQAVASYDRALEIKPDYWEAWIGRGNAASNSSNYIYQPNLFSSITATNPALNARGYDGKVASYQEGLRYVLPDSYPEGWGKLHLALGNAYYEQGKKDYNLNYWQLAAQEYEIALNTLTPEAFVELHLEVLQNLIKALVGLRQTATAQELLRQGTDLLHSLLDEPTRTDEGKKQLALRFVGFKQLAVDITVQCGELLQALEIAESGKNACLTWLLSGWAAEIPSPNYKQIQQLLNSQTAIVYWHISSCTLHTFVVGHNSTEPIPVFTPVLNTPEVEAPLPEAVQRLVEFENWLEDWNQQYQEYSNEIEDKQRKSSHSWMVDMEQRLLNLKNILSISTIEHELQGISQLILIPHRDLQRLPLHNLFSGNLNITYLPSAEIGLKLQQRQDNTFCPPKLLIVEQPNSTIYPQLKFAKLEAEFISQIFDNHHLIQGLQATKKQVKDGLAGDYNIFHFTGYVDDNLGNPQASAFLLADEDKFTSSEIRENSFANYNLVTLSASQTAITHPQTITTEYTSLVTSFLCQGVAHVVTTSWNVESPASALVMIEFYQRLHQDKSKSASLAEATAWLRELTAGELKAWYEELLKKLPKERFRIRAHLATELYKTSQMPADTKLFNHPYHWGGFMIAGIGE